MQQDFAHAGREPSRLFISDTHLFHPHNGALQYQGAMIEQTKPDELYILGDGIDYEKMLNEIIKYNNKNNAELTTPPDTFMRALSLMPTKDIERHLRLYDVLIAAAINGTKIYYIPGNHDNNLRALNGQNIDGLIEYHDDMVININGKNTLLEHGHLNDKYCSENYEGYAAWGSRILDGSIAIDHSLNALKSKFLNQAQARHSYHFSNTVKEFGKGVVEDFYLTAIERLKKRGLDAAIMGHIHKAKIYDSDFKILTSSFIANFDAPNSSPTKIITETNTPANTFYNTGDGFTHGTGLYHSPETGFKILDKKNLQHSQTFNTSQPSPYPLEYRIQALKILQAQYETFKAVANLELGWSHSGVHKSTTHTPKETTPTASVA